MIIIQQHPSCEKDFKLSFHNLSSLPLQNFKHPLIHNNIITVFLPYLLGQCLDSCISDCSNFVAETARSVSPNFPTPFSTSNWHALGLQLLRCQGDLSFKLNDYQDQIINECLLWQTENLFCQHITDISKITEPTIIVAVGPYGYCGKHSNTPHGHSVAYIPTKRIFIEQRNWKNGLGLKVRPPYNLSSLHGLHRLLFCFHYRRKIP